MVEITQEAADRIKGLLAADGRQGHGLRFGLQDGGCSGYTYLLEFEEAPEDEDHVVEAHGVRVFIHPMHLPFIQGSVIGWRDDLMEAGIKVDNPNVQRACGCGESVTF
jgi:iron-sulfur cluster assembly protein